MIVPQSSDIDKQKALPDVPAAAGSSRVSPSASAAPGTAVGSLSLQPPPYEPGSGASSSQQHLRQAENSAAYAQQPLSSPRAFAAPPSPSPSHSHFPYSPDPNAISHSTAINAGPPSFSRLPSQEPAYPVFPPMCLLASGKYLTKGFPAVPPPSKVEYHPFTTHDITQEDWQSFIQDLNKAAELKAKEVDQAWSLPIISWFPYINNVAAIAFKTYIKRRKEKPVSDRIYEWNHYFFHPRKLDVYLTRGIQRIGRSHHAEHLDKDGSSPDARPSDKGDEAYRLWVKPLDS